MGKGYFLYHGDKTTCGGRILDGAPDDTYLGKRKVRERDRVSCGKNEGVFLVCGGMGDSYSVDGVIRQWAGSIESFSSCPCRAKFIPTMLTDSYEYNCNAGLAAERARGEDKKASQGGEPEQHAQAARKKAQPENRYTVTIYAAYPGTPLNDIKTGKPEFKNGKRVVSSAGHMWVRIKKLEGTQIKEDISYGFAPINTGVVGPGVVDTEDSKHYELPYYSRTIEITAQQYENIAYFCVTAKNKSNKYFDLYYNGAKNSCIDFAFQSLRFAGLRPEGSWNDLSDYNRVMKATGEFDGDLKVINNIPHIKAIPAPYPESELNTEHYNKKPDRAFLQWLLSKSDEEESIGDIAKR